MYAVILAGGGGTRLWPLSRVDRPKPFLPLLEGGRCLLEATVARLAPLIEPADVFVVTDARHVPLVRAVVPSLPAANIVAEPAGRNTAAAVALAAVAIDRPADEVMVSLHADQAIRDEAGFRAALAAAVGRAAGGDIVTVGITPTGPETGYGYILATGEVSRHAGRETWRVQRFEEKPTLERAEVLIAGGRAYWNAGSFVWRRDVLRAGLAEHAPDIERPLSAWSAAHGGRILAEDAPPWPGEALAEVYAGLPARAIDYALLEPASLQGRVAVVPASVGWSDLGSWSALRDHLRDADGSVIEEVGRSRVVDVGSREVFVHAGSGRTVAVVGLGDVIVVDTPDALLVSSAAAAQDVKVVVDRLREAGLEELL